MHQFSYNHNLTLTILSHFLKRAMVWYKLINSLSYGKSDCHLNKLNTCYDGQQEHNKWEKYFNGTSPGMIGVPELLCNEQKLIQQS